MLWLESVIGTALWCWWQVPARRYNGASGRFELDWRLGAFAARSCCDVTVFMGRQSETPPKKRGPPATGKGEPILVRLQPASSGDCGPNRMNFFWTPARRIWKIEKGAINIGA
jgi:hypothetical protein